MDPGAAGLVAPCGGAGGSVAAGAGGFVRAGWRLRAAELAGTCAAGRLAGTGAAGGGSGIGGDEQAWLRACLAPESIG